MSLYITAYVNRTTTERITISGRDLNNVVTQPSVGDSDQIRVKIGRGDVVKKDIVSGAALTNGTTVTRANPCTLTIVGTDFADLPPGAYDIEVAVVDHGDSDRTKHADEGVFVLIGTQGGSLGQPS
jgi:hypothetical protein